MTDYEEMLERSFRFILMLFIFGATASCQVKLGTSSTIDGSRFDYKDFYSDTYRLVLCFDLRDDAHPLAGLVIKTSSTQTPEQHIIMLPFGSTSASPNETLFTTTGTYKDFTLIHYILSSRSGGTTGIGIVPIMDSLPEATTYSMEDLSGTLYLIRSGLERRFIYKYPSLEPGSSAPPTEIQSIPTATLDAIAVAIPSSATRKEIRNGQTEIPARLSNNRIAAFYLPNNLQSKVLEIRYDVPPSTEQKLVLEYGIKAIAAILTPLLGLLFLDSKKTGKSKFVVLAIGAIIEIIILVLVWRVALIVKGESELKTTYDLIVVVVGAVFSVVVLGLKAKAEQKTAHNP